MKKAIFMVFCMLGMVYTHAQSYSDTLLAHRQTYISAFFSEEEGPLKYEDTAYLRFFNADSSYRIVAQFTPTPDAKSITMPTHSGKIKKYKPYGYVSFNHHDTTVKLTIYQSEALMKKPDYEDYLFLPFKDMSNYTDSYGGGRYMDLRFDDIKGDKVVLDFNKCYNPYCAYTDGYNCPIPPDENKLPVAIMAGEKIYGRHLGE